MKAATATISMPISLFNRTKLNWFRIPKTLKYCPQYSRSFNFNNRMTNVARLSSSSATPPTEDDTPPSSSSSGVIQPKPKPWLIVGLGNPGKKYASTRHNVGFEMVDYIAGVEGIPMNCVSFKALFGKVSVNLPKLPYYYKSIGRNYERQYKLVPCIGIIIPYHASAVDTLSYSAANGVSWDPLLRLGRIGNVPVMLSKPQTFMNLSGESVGPMVSYYKIPLSQVLVIYDDLDLPFGKLRLHPKGGHGGQNGMRSVIDHFKGNRDFPRLKIGIGRPPGKIDPISYVMRPFNKEERQELDFAMQNGVEAVRILLAEGFDKSATFINSPKPLECS